MRCKTKNPRRSEQGYILLMLMLMVTVLAIVATAVAPSIIFRAKRDREEEMIHRGVQYSRAIRHYVKKFGHYPARIEELENTNNQRFLRKRYKDPITGQDFKILHQQDIKTNFGAGIAGAANIGIPASALNSAAGSGGLSVRGGVGAGSPSLTGAAAQGTATVTTANSGTNTSIQDVNQASAGGQSQSTSDQPASGNPSSDSPATDDKPSPQFGGQPIVGVASTSKAETIREFNKKNHYNDWQFIYDPTTDRGGLLNTPAQPPLQVVTPIPQQGTPGTTGPGLGTNSGSMGMQNQPMPQQPMPQQPMPQNPPPQPPQQQ